LRNAFFLAPSAGIPFFFFFFFLLKPEGYVKQKRTQEIVINTNLPNAMASTVLSRMLLIGDTHSSWRSWEFRYGVGLGANYTRYRQLAGFESTLPSI